MVLACLSGGIKGIDTLSNLATSLSHRRFVRLLIEVMAFDQDLLAQQFLSICLEKSMLNVELYFRNYNHSFYLYTHQVFPKFEVVKRRISENVTIFTNKLRNLQGYRLRVLPDFSPPNTFDYRDALGKYQVAGFLWDFIANFANHLNAGLKIIKPSWRFEPGDARYMFEFTGNGSVDFGLYLVLINPRNVWAINQFSYPVFISCWCTMMPVEKPLPTAELFGRILCPAVMMVLLFLLICWLLFSYLITLKFRRLVKVIPRLLTLFLITTCSSQLLSLLISPPYQERISSFDELLISNQRILGIHSEFYYLDGAFRARYAHAFHLVKDPNELYELRNHFNTTWAYTMAYTKWMVITMQQRHFAKPLFRLQKDLCFFDFIPTSIVMAPESIYSRSLKEFTMRAWQTGLLDHWVRKSFYDMVKAGRMSIKDYSEKVMLYPMRVGDLKLAWRIFGGAGLLAIGVFLLELLYFYINRFLDNF